MFFLADAKPLTNEIRRFVCLPGGAYLKEEIEFCPYLDTMPRDNGQAFHFFEIPQGESEKFRFANPREWNPIRILED